MLRALVGGASGALTVTVVNEVARRLIPHAPRMEVIGMRALAQSMLRIEQEPPAGDRLFGWALVGDIISNTVYYSIVGAGDARGAWRRGTVMGLAAGLGAVLLPRPLGLGRQPGARFPITQLLTVAWYLLGGLAAAAVHRRSLSQRK